MDIMLYQFIGKTVFISIIDRHGIEPTYGPSTLNYVGVEFLSVTCDDGRQQLIRISEIEAITEKTVNKR
jgi:hypothetical protein